MKYLIVSDIHGDELMTKFIYDEFKNNNYDKILLLGDVLYHGPRNDLPKGYNPKGCIKLLNELADKIIWIKGNCDAEVDEMVLDFKVNDYVDTNLNGLNSHLEHGHHLDLYTGHPDLVLYGHTHLPDLTKFGNTVFLNPGSISIPKGGFEKSYATLDGKDLKIIDINNNIINSYKFS